MTDASIVLDDHQRNIAAPRLLAMINDELLLRKIQDWITGM